MPFSFKGRPPVAVGSRWVEGYGLASDQCSEHCGYQYSFANIATGQVRTLDSWHPGGTTVPDLNSAGLAARLCSPLRVPHGLRDNPPTDPGLFTFAGPFAVGLDWKFEGTYPYQPNQVSLLLERCGTRLRRVLTSQTYSPLVGFSIGETDNQFAINRHAVIWLNPQAGPLHGAFLPSLKQFRIPLGRIAPPARQGGYEPPSRSIFLASGTLYVWNHDVGSDLLAATAPQPK